MTPDSLRQAITRVIPLLQVASSLTSNKVDDDLVKLLQLALDDTTLLEDLFGLLQARGLA